MRYLLTILAVLLLAGTGWGQTDSTTYYIGSKALDDSAEWSGTDMYDDAYAPIGESSVFSAEADDSVIRFWVYTRTNNDNDSLHAAIYVTENDSCKTRLANSYTGFIIGYNGGEMKWWSSDRVSIPLADTTYAVAYGDQVQIGTEDGVRVLYRDLGSGHQMHYNTTGLDNPFGAGETSTEMRPVWAEVLRVTSTPAVTTIGPATIGAGVTIGPSE